MNAEDILRLIEEMESGERWKLLNEVYDLYYNKDESTKGIPLDIDY
ncbi:TPA: hypothetical protein ACGW68_005996 [Bacillus cereus]|nr:hypothetical protein [Bacillus cereus]